MTKPKTALITGAAVRIGRALALSLADAGWDIALHYNTSGRQAAQVATLVRDRGRKAYTVQANLAEEKAIAAIFPALKKQGVVPDCLINNAAVFEKDSLATLAQRRWQTQMDINLFAPLLLMRDFAVHYKGSEGNIINITDGLSGWSMSASFLSYSLAKEGLAQATRMLAHQLAPRIRVNAIAPGATLVSKHDTKETFRKLANIIPLQRVSSPAEVCDAAHYLLAARSLTGQILSLSGGMEAGG